MKSLFFDYTLQVWVRNGVCEDVGSGRELYAGMWHAQALAKHAELNGPLAS